MVAWESHALRWFYLLTSLSLIFVTEALENDLQILGKEHVVPAMFHIFQCLQL